MWTHHMPQNATDSTTQLYTLSVFNSSIVWEAQASSWNVALDYPIVKANHYSKYYSFLLIMKGKGHGTL